MVFACALVALGAGLLYSKSSTKIFQASVLLEIDPHATQPLGEKTSDVLDMGTGNYWDTRDYYETQYKIITSDRVLGDVVRDLALASDKTFIKQGSAKKATVEDATSILRKNVTVEPLRNSRLVYVRVEDVDPDRAKRVCDAVANAYIEQNLQTAQNATSDAVVWLNSQLDHVKLDLEHDENTLYEFKQRNDLPST
ncbi:MAG: GumC family protein, partial [Polyangiaceae bacterium]